MTALTLNAGIAEGVEVLVSIVCRGHLPELAPLREGEDPCVVDAPL
jgi:hypothetical protein